MIYEYFSYLCTRKHETGTKKYPKMSVKGIFGMQK